MKLGTLIDWLTMKLGTTHFRTRHFRTTLHALLLAAAALVSMASEAAQAKVGMGLAVDVDGPFWNPVVNKIKVKEVEKASLAEAAGIVAGDEIVQIEGRVVAGQHANDLKDYMKFNPGETRTLRVRHANGNEFEARITKPKE